MPSGLMRLTLSKSFARLFVLNDLKTLAHSGASHCRRIPGYPKARPKRSFCCESVKPKFMRGRGSYSKGNGETNADAIRDTFGDPTLLSQPPGSVARILSELRLGETCVDRVKSGDLRGSAPK